MRQGEVEAGEAGGAGGVRVGREGGWGERAGWREQRGVVHASSGGQLTSTPPMSTPERESWLGLGFVSE